MHAVRSETLGRELYLFDTKDALRVSRIVVEMIRAARFEDAISLARACVRLSPRSGEAWNVLAYAYSHVRGLEQEATAAAREAVLQGPNDPSAWHNLSLGLMRLFEFDRALEASGRALALPSENPYYPMQAAFLASLVGDNRRALELLQSARGRVDTGHAERARFLAEIDIQAAINHASLGDWENFCRLLDSRHELSTARPGFLHDAWSQERLWTQNTDWDKTGDALVYLEWGIGDQIQFARLIPLVLRQIAKFARVTVACSAPLVKLMGAIEGVDAVIDQASPTLSTFNVRPDVAIVPVIDLMRELQRFGMFPLGSFTGPYLRPPPAEMAWEPGRQSGKIAIAFCWQGDPRQAQDFNRRIPFEEWGRFAARCSDRYSFHSVQSKYAGNIDPWQGWPDRVPVENCAPYIRDMRDVAEIISKCDVFVGQCGANLHLAGAMGKPAVALLGASHDFRWDFEPLYGCELLEQKRAGDWPSAFAYLESAIDRALTRRPAEFQKER
jgi:tetratricopeptide (TPR) repeat protein